MLTKNKVKHLTNSAGQSYHNQQLPGMSRSAVNEPREAAIAAGAPLSDIEDMSPNEPLEAAIAEDVSPKEFVFAPQQVLEETVHSVWICLASTDNEQR